MMKSLKIGDLLARTPIVQGGMGVGISLSGLASAVANEGGVGVISSAGLGVIYRDYSPDYNIASIWGLREELRKAREKTRGIIGVNVMVAMSNFADMVKTAIQGEGRHHLLGCRAAVEPAVVPHRGLPHETGADRLVGPCRETPVRKSGWPTTATFPTRSSSKGRRPAATRLQGRQIEDEHYSLRRDPAPPIVEEVHAFEAAHDCHIPVIAGGGATRARTSTTFCNWGPRGADGHPLRGHRRVRRRSGV